LAYFTQVGISVITPPLVCAFAAMWLRDRFQWGNGVVVAGILLGVAIAIVSLREFLRLAEREARKSQDEKEKLP
jgi:positive regulator of sigma E activity